MELYTYIAFTVLAIGGWQLVALILRRYSGIFDIFSHAALITWVLLLLNLGILSVYQNIWLILVNSAIVVPLTLYVVEYFERARIAPTGSAGQRLRIMSYNVKYGQYRHSDATDYMVREAPDVLIVIEPNANWEWHLNRIDNVYPFSLTNLDARDGYGIALFSKYALEGEIQIFEDVPYIDVSLNVEGRRVRLVGVHLPNPIHLWRGRWGSGRRLTQRILDSIAADEAAVLIGDLNATPNGAIYRQIIESRKLQPAPLRRTLLPTWFLGPVPLLQIDHAFVTRGVNVVACGLGERNQSDHRPLILDVELE